MARVLSLVDELEERPHTRPIRIEQKSNSSAVIDGGGHTGYITSVIAMDKAIELGKETGLGLVGLRNSWFSGQLSYYVGRAAEAGLIAIHCTNAKARVAPAGGIDATSVPTRWPWLSMRSEACRHRHWYSPSRSRSC
jgi:LDH2 family malate/lactate/ureidoglycolate dehydrogenase